MSEEPLADLRPTVTRHSVLLPFSALVLAALAWAGNAVVGRGIRHAYDPLELTFYRWGIACLFLYAVNGKATRAEFCQARRNFGHLLAGAVCGMAGFHLLQYFALSRLPATEVAVIVGATPLAVTTIQVALRRAYPAPGIAFGICLGMCGVFLVCYRAGEIPFHGSRPWAGIGAAIAAMVCWSAWSVRFSQCKDMSWLGTLFYMSLASTVMLLPAYVCDVIISGARLPNLQLLTQILYLGIPASVVAYALYNFGIQRVGALRAAQFNSLIPAFASVLAALLLNESMSAFQVCGLILVVVSLNFIVLAKSPDAWR